MRLYPAIDIKNGQCVRLIQGDMAQATVFDRTPADQAAHWQACGFEYLHVVDLNGAFDGRSTNADSVRDILSRVSIPVQLGGGIRDRAGIDFWLHAGIARVILGTAAVRDPELVRAAARNCPGQICVGLDVKNGHVAVEGWAEVGVHTALDLAKAFADCGVAAVIVTDIARDGLKTGLNVALTGEIAAHIEAEVIASGGLASIDDVAACLQHAGPRAIGGAILGRALYDGAIDPAAALALAKAGANA